MEISKELAQDILAHMSCADTNCDECRLNGKKCGDHHKRTADTLRAVLEDVEQNDSVSQETEKGAEPTSENKTTEYITITVAEYHCLTKAAAMLEVIMNDQTYEHTAVVNAVKATIEAMQAGAAE